MADVQQLQLNDLPELAAARSAWQQGKTEFALSQFDAAVKSHPKNLKACLEFAKALQLDFQLQRARQVLRHSIRLVDARIDVVAQVAKALASVQLFDEAIELLFPFRSTPIAAVQLAVIHEQLGQFEAALDVIDAAENETPPAPEFELVRIRILTHLRKLDLAEEAICRLIGRLLDLKQRSAPLSPQTVIRAYYQAGLIMDYQGNYEAAFQSVETAKSIQRQLPATRQLAAAQVRHLRHRKELLAQLDASIVERWQTTPVAPLPYKTAHLVGFPRSGTTLLEQLLDAQDSIKVSSEQLLIQRAILDPLRNDGRLSPETFDGLPVEKISGLRTRYQGLVNELHGDIPAGSIHVDKRPANLGFLPHLLRVFPDTKWIVMLRDPRDILVSCYTRYFPLTDMSSHLVAPDSAAKLISDTFEYWLTLKPWLDSSSWIEVRYEDACDQLAIVGQRVMSFLGLSDQPLVDYRLSLQEKYIHSPSFADVRRPVYHSRISRWQHYEQYLGSQFEFLMPIVKQLGYDH